MIAAVRLRWISLLFFLVSITPAFSADRVGKYLRNDLQWFRSPEGQSITRNILSWQTPEGSWPKNIETTLPFDNKPQKGTFDNGATTDELRFLARAFTATTKTDCKEAFLKGLDHILLAQYPIGGWPQYHPPGKGYHRHITFNDGTMVRLMNFVRDVAREAEFAFVDENRRNSARAAFDRGIDCILRSQVRVNDSLTVWCAQHDELTLDPRPARAFELASLSGAESVGILVLLMSIENPSEAIVRAVDAGIQWFENVRITGLREVKVNGDKTIITDPEAPALWARFYEIDTNRPIFAGRDGVKRYSISEIEPERRNGYAWYGHWPKALPEKYERWKEHLKQEALQEPAPK